MKLNGSTQYQHIQLVRSPIFVNETFTINVWLNPNVQPKSVYCLLAQFYEGAPDLTFNIVDQYAMMRVYNSRLWSTTKLKNFQWQHVTFEFAQKDLSMAIYIDGIINARGTMVIPQYGNFEIQRTIIGSYGDFNQYNGLIDQLSIAFHIKSNIDILDEATQVVHYKFEGDDKENDFLFQDSSVNNIRARGSHVSRLVGNRKTGQGTLFLYDPVLSYFQSGGFVLLSTHNYSYSYALWLNISSVSSFMPLVHLVTRDELSSLENNSSTCLALLAIKRTGFT